MLTFASIVKSVAALRELGELVEVAPTESGEGLRFPAVTGQQEEVIAAADITVWRERIDGQKRMDAITGPCACTIAAVALEDTDATTMQWFSLLDAIESGQPLPVVPPTPEIQIYYVARATPEGKCPLGSHYHNFGNWWVDEVTVPATAGGFTILNLKANPSIDVQQVILRATSYEDAAKKAEQLLTVIRQTLV